MILWIRVEIEFISFTHQVCVSYIKICFSVLNKLLYNFSFNADKVFDEQCSTFDVYQEFAAPVVLSAMQGFNGKISLEL